MFMYKFLSGYISPGYTPKSGIAGSCGISLFNHLRNCQTVFHPSYIIVHSHQQCMRAPISPLQHQHLLLSVSLILAILVGMKWDLTVVLISNLASFF